MNCRENNLSTKSVSDLSKLESTSIPNLANKMPESFLQQSQRYVIYKSKYRVKNSKQDSDNQWQIHSSFFGKLSSHNNIVLLHASHATKQRRQQKLIKPKI